MEERQTPARLKWVVSIQATNDQIGEGNFAYEVAKALSAYADLVERGLAANSRDVEEFVTEAGTRLTVTGAWCVSEPTRL